MKESYSHQAEAEDDAYSYLFPDCQLQRPRNEDGYDQYQQVSEDIDGGTEYKEQWSIYAMPTLDRLIPLKCNWGALKDSCEQDGDRQSDTENH